jgi:hypothetical protein
MQSLSTQDGSAEAVRKAADGALPTDDNRLALERELDRLNFGVHGTTAAMIQHLNWMLMSQAFLLVAYLIVLVGAWGVALPGKRWLMASIAGFGTVVMLLAYFGVRGHLDRIGPLKLARRTIEEALERVAARPSVFSRQSLLVVALADWSTRVLPAVMIGGWLALALYTLSVPMPTDVRTAAPARGETKAVQPATTGRNSARPAPRKAEAAPAAEEVTSEAAAEPESPLTGFLRRALNQPPPAEETTESVKP